MSGPNIEVVIDIDLEELIPGFMENRNADVTKLKEAIMNQDFETLRSVGHSLKGVGGGYGFDYISEIGALVETGAKLQDTSSINDSINKLQSYLQNVKIIFE